MIGLVTTWLGPAAPLSAGLDAAVRHFQVMFSLNSVVWVGLV